MYNQNEMSLVERFTAPTPKLFSTIRNIGLFIVAIATLIISYSKQIDMPEFLLVIASKVTIISGLVSAIIAQLTVDYKEKALEDATDNKTRGSSLLILLFLISSCSRMQHTKVIEIQTYPHGDSTRWYAEIIVQQKSGTTRRVMLERSEAKKLKVGQLLYCK